MQKSKLDFAMTLFLRTMLLVSFCAWLSSCAEGIITDPRQIVFPESNVSFGQHVLPLMNVSCAFSGCHGSSPARNIRLTTYTDILSFPGLVLAGRPQQSTLSLVMDGSIPHPPSFQASLTTNHINGIKTWIREGARSN
jgi:hypothetical protein